MLKYTRNVPSDLFKQAPFVFNTEFVWIRVYLDDFFEIFTVALFVM